MFLNMNSHEFIFVRLLEFECFNEYKLDLLGAIYSIENWFKTKIQISRGTNRHRLIPLHLKSFDIRRNRRLPNNLSVIRNQIYSNDHKSLNYYNIAKLSWKI